MMMRWKRWLALFVVGIAISLGGCDPSNFRTEAAQIPRLVDSELSDPKTFNSVTSREANMALGLMYEGMIGQNGLTGELEPGIAESWEVSPDSLRIIFKLREGLKWSDGQPLTVDDVVFSFNQIYFNKDIPSGESDIIRIGEQGVFPQVVKLDDRRIEFISPEPFAPLLRYGGGFAILPKHALEKAVTEKDAKGQLLFNSMWGTDTPPSQIVSNGPYRLLSYQPSERVILERNPHYWRKDAAGNQQPFIDRFVIEIIESTDNELIQFRSGGLDVTGITPDYFSLIKGEEERGKFTVYNGGSTLSTTFLTFNQNKGIRNGKPLVDPIKSRWFNNQKFRQAVAYAIDRDTMINNIYQGLGAPQNSPIPEKSPFYLSPEQGLPVYNYNPEKAKQLLQEGGFKYTPQGQLQDADGNPVRFALITNSGNKIRESMGVQIQKDLAKIGITVDFQPISFNALVSKLSNSLDWEAHILGFSGGGVEPQSGFNIWSPDGTLHTFNQKALPGQDPIEGRVVADWEQEIGRLYIKGSQELNEDKRKEIYAQTQLIAQEQLPFIHLINQLSLVAVRDRVQGVKFSSLGGWSWNIHELQLSEE